jgi:hypothetical protein
MRPPPQRWGDQKLGSVGMTSPQPVRTAPLKEMQMGGTADHGRVRTSLWEVAE